MYKKFLPFIFLSIFFINFYASAGESDNRTGLRVYSGLAGLMIGHRVGELVLPPVSNSYFPILESMLRHSACQTFGIGGAFLGLIYGPVVYDTWTYKNDITQKDAKLKINYYNNISTLGFRDSKKSIIFQSKLTKIEDLDEENTTKKLDNARMQAAATIGVMSAVVGGGLILANKYC
jgi:hypothetical protein